MNASQASLVMSGLMLLPAAPCDANDFPTTARVEFVLDCMRSRTGAEFELLSKCSCAVDRLAAAYKYDDFVEAQTSAKAVTIAGERGAAVRDNDETRSEAKRYRASVDAAERACRLAKAP